MLRIAIAAALTIHGVIHLIGFLVPWHLAVIPGYPDPTVAAWGHLHLGAATARALGLAWLAVALAFVIAGGGVVVGAAWAVPLAAVAACGSLALCVLGSPAAVAGVAVNVALLLLFGYAWFGRSAIQLVR